jgi:hypothetical protein
MAVALTLRERALALTLRERAVLLSLRASDVFTESEAAVAGVARGGGEAFAVLSTGIALSALAAGRASAAGALGDSQAAALAGAAAGASAASGALATGISITAVAAGRASATGDLAAVAVALAATSTGAGSAAGALVTAIPLTAAARGESAAAGAVLIPIPLTATLAGATLTDYPVEFTLHYGIGPTSGFDAYLAETCRTDFADVRFKDAVGTRLPFWIREKVDGDYARCVVLVPEVPGSVTIVANVTAEVSGPTLKLGLIGDPHNAAADFTGTGYVSHRTQVVPWLDRFNTRMGTFAPDYVVAMGDNSTASGAGDKTSLLAAVESKLAENTAPHLVIVGNHDFEYATAAEVRAALAPSQTYLQAGKLYGSFDTADFHVVVLDPIYADTTPFAHASLDGNFAHGYIPDGTAGSDDQFGWLTADLAATTKPTIVFCHITLDEFDGSTFYTLPTSDFSRYAVTNRAAVRAVLEASGKVAAVIHGHQHFFRTAIVKGIPYIHTPSFCDTGAYPFRAISDSDRGRWVELTLDHAKGEITADLYEDHSTRGAELAARQVVYYDATGADLPSNPYRVYASGNAAAIGAASTGAPSFDGGDLTQWTVLTNTAAGAPVDMTLAQTKFGDPVTAGGGLTLKGGTTASPGTATRRFAEQAGRFRAGLDLKLDQTNKLLNVYLVNPTATLIGPYLKFTAAGTVTTGAGAALGTYTTAAMRIEIIGDLATDTYDVLINGEVRGTGLAFHDGALAALDRLRLHWPAGADGTAHVDNLYVRPDAATEPTVAVWAGGPDVPEIARASTGKLLWDDFSGTLDAWTLVGSVVIDAGKAKTSGNVARLTRSFTSTAGIYVCYKMRLSYNATYAGDGRLLVSGAASVQSDNYELGIMGGANAARNSTIGEAVGGARTTLRDWGVRDNGTAEHSYALKIAGGSIQGYLDGVAQGAAVSDSTQTTFDKLQLLTVINPADTTGYGTFENVAVSKSHAITVNGLPTGWKARCASVTAAESGGTATLDLSGKMFPQSLLEVLDEANVVRAFIDLANDIWGGDVFTVTP